MKHFIPILFIAVLTACSTPGKSGKPIFGKSEIDVNNVQSIMIGVSQDDLNARKLTDQEITEFVETWNGARSNGMCKYLPEYWITIRLKDSNERTFRINGASIKESNDECFDLGDDKMAEGWYK